MLFEDGMFKDCTSKPLAGFTEHVKMLILRGFIITLSNLGGFHGEYITHLMDPKTIFLSDFKLLLQNGGTRALERGSFI